eukprot:Sspe_Gene.1046::Locus_353_Transcript_1_1_Confidence_1.000_Length_1206::g.1046::m.1046/K03237/EIF2S1; translation initiation factor 2 subunit 1
MASEKPVKEIGTCRFYEKKYPDLDDLVMVKIRTISPSAAYVHLLEYNNVEGMISMSEVSRRRIRSIGKHLKVGGTEVVQVIRVDKEKGYIDLSKKKVMANDKKKCEENYNHAKAIHSIMTHVARQADSITSLERSATRRWLGLSQLSTSVPTTPSALRMPTPRRSLAHWSSTSSSTAFW